MAATSVQIPHEARFTTWFLDFLRKELAPYPGRGTIETVDSPIHVAGSEKRRPLVPPEFGAHTRVILKEAGYSEAEVERMIQSGIAVAASEPHSER